MVLIMITFVVMTARASPYQSRKLNSLEIASLFASGITLYCGLYFLSSKSPSDASFKPSRDCKI